MKKNTLSILLLVSSIFTLNAQNAIWTIPPNYIKGGAVYPLPVAQSVPGYDGLPTQYPHNAMQDENGNLLFFVVGASVYDKDGKWIGDIKDSLGGHTEIVIVPVPNSCERYYIVLNRYSGLGYAKGSLGAQYVVVDLTMQNAAIGAQGILVDPDDPTNNAYYSATPIRLDTEAPNWHHDTFAGYAGSIAVTKIRPDGTRLIFFQEGFNVHRFLITSSGIFYEDFFPISCTYSTIHDFGEMEIIETPIGYRIAFSFFSSSQVCPESGHALFIGELNSSGELVSSNHPIVYPYSSANIIISGIEFSSNGNYIYVTHGDTQGARPSLLVFDILGNEIPISNQQLLNDISDFSRSQIEMGRDGKLYLINNNRLASIENSNNPTSLIWNNSAFTASYSGGHGYYPGSTSYVYFLPDQIDGMDYTIDPTWTIPETALVCPGECYQVGSECYYAGGPYFYNSQICCCKKTRLTVIEYDVVSDRDISICQGAMYQLPENNAWYSNGSYQIPFVDNNGCDAIINLTVTEEPPVETNRTITVCAGAQYQMPENNVLYSGGSYQIPYTDNGGCDAIINLTVAEEPPVETDRIVTVCAGDQYQAPENNVSYSDGSYQIPYVNNDGCDAIINLTVTEEPPVETDRIVAVCPGGQYQMPENGFYYSEGSHTAQVKDSMDCEVIINLTVNGTSALVIQGCNNICQSSKYENGAEVIYEYSALGSTNSYQWYGNPTDVEIVGSNTENTVRVRFINPNATTTNLELTASDCNLTSSYTVNLDACIDGCGSVCIGATEIDGSPIYYDFYFLGDASDFEWSTDDLDIEVVSFSNSTVQVSFPSTTLSTAGQNTGILKLVTTTCDQSIVHTMEIFLDDECVWPGDVNYDNEVGQVPSGTDFNILTKLINCAPLLGNPVTGPSRPQNCHSNFAYEWEPHPSPSWGYIPALTGKDIKHVDCDGDGQLTSSNVMNYNPSTPPQNDGQVIAYNVANSSRVHNEQLYSKITQNSVSENIFFTPLVDTIENGILYHLGQISLGTPDEAVFDVNGVAFDIGLDASMFTEFYSNIFNSHLGFPGWDLDGFGVVTFDSSYAVTSFNRLDGNFRNFNGELVCDIYATIELNNFASVSNEFAPIELTVSNAFKMTSGNQLTPLDGCIKTIYVQTERLIKVSPKILLGSPHLGNGIMSDILRTQSCFPLDEPYAGLGFNLVRSGEEQIAETILEVTGNNSIVDWIVVELRSSSDNNEVIATRSALLQKDGDVVDVDGTSPVTFYGLSAGEYFVCIHHRNHLDVMTTQSIYLEASTTEVDFTTNPYSAYGNNPQGFDGSYYFLWPGDANNDNSVDASDRSATWNYRNTSDYLGADLNLDGTVDAADRSIAWNNRNKVAQLP